MAEDKLGTLEYDMLIDEEKLTKQLQNIDKLLKIQDDKWKEALANVGGSATFNIDTSKLVTANKAVESGATNLKTSIKQLKKELNDNITTYEKYSQAQRENTNYAAKTLSTIQDQKNKLAELGEAYRAQITKERELVRERNRLAAESRNIAKLQSVVDTAPNEIAKIKAINKELEYQKTLKQNTGNQDALNKQIIANQALITKKQEEIRLNERLISQELQRQKIISTLVQYPEGTVGNINAQIKLAEFNKSVIPKAENEALDRQSILIKQLNEQKKQLLATEKQQAAQQRANLQQDKLKAAVQSQEVGSIARLRAEYALLAFQYGQVGKTIPFTTQKVKELTTAMAQNRAQMAQLQPTLGMWGKLVSAIRTYATAYLSVQAVMGLGRAVFTQTKELDQLEFSMRTVIKSSTELAQTQKFLSEVAINYGGDLLTLSERYIKFRAAALQSNMSAAETQKIYDSVSKAAGTLGLKTDELSGVYLALEQMISKGKVTTEELRRQLGERLPGAFGIMANALGVTIPQLDKMLKKGEVLSKDALPKFAAALEKAYGLEAVKKIDTLAAAQGRMSTQFTMLIKEIGASDSFKGFINGIASFLGFIKDNLSVIGFFAKALLTVTTAITLNKLAVAVSIPIQKALLLTYGYQTSALTQLTFAQMRLLVAQRAAAVGTTALARAWNALKVAIATNPIGAALTAITLIVSAVIMFKNKTKETIDELTQLNKQLDTQKAIINGAADSMSKAEKGSNLYKESLQQLNTIALKYNQTLLTEKSNLQEVNSAREKTISLLDKEYNKKRRVVEIDAANAKLSAVLDPLKDAFYGKYEDDAAQASRAYNKFLDEVKAGKNAFQLTDYFKDDITKDAIEGIREFEKSMQRIEKQYGKEIDIVAKIDISELSNQLKAAKEEFENIRKIGAEDIGEITFFDEEKGIKTYTDYLNSLLNEYNAVAKKITFEEFKLIPDVKPQTKDQQLSAYEDYSNDLLENAKQIKLAREEILLELKEEEERINKENKPYNKLLEKRNEAIDELNKKYLQDKRDFTNADLEITAGFIASLEDGIEKEKKLNELSYQNRIKAIDKETEARLKLINEIAGTEKKPLITSLEFDASKYSKEVQDALAEARANEATMQGIASKEKNDRDVAITKEYAEKIKEIQRDVSDEFLTGVAKEKAAIKEKYDAWEKAAKLADPLDLTGEQAKIKLGRETANAEVDRRFRLDELEFFREIEYKKNEIAYGASLNRRKLDKANFDTYVKYERQKIAELRASALNDNKILADQKELELSTDIDLENTKYKVELQKDIIEAGKELTSILKEQLDLTDEQAKAFDSIVSAITQLASGNYVGAALSSLIAAASIMLDDSKVAERLSKPWEEFENWVVRSNAALQRYIDLRDEAIGAERFSSSSLVIEKIANDIKEAEKILSESKLSLAFEATGWPANAWDDLKKQVAEAGKELGGTLEKASENAFSLGVWAKVKQTWTFDLDQLLFSETGEFTLTKINELIDEGIITDAKVIEAVKNYETLVGQLAEAEKQKQELLTATMASNIADSISEGFRNGLDSAADFADTFEEYIRGAIDNALKILSEPAFKKWYEDLAAAMESGGGLDKDEIAKLKLDWDSLIQIEKQRRDATYELTGLSTYTGDSIDSGMYKGIQGVQEATARRLEGLINTIRETGVKNLDNARELLLSSQMIQAYSGQSLAKLTNIDSNIALQLALFNGIMTTASGVGGAGLKVYIQ